MPEKGARVQMEAVGAEGGAEAPGAATAAAKDGGGGAPARADWLGLLARAPGARLAALAEALRPWPEIDWLRRPEIGSVMLRGRAGATGAPFNLGEMTVTRATLRLGCGTVGHGWVQGRDAAACAAAALIDALMQRPGAAGPAQDLVARLAAEEAERRAARAARAAATRVEFFTLARGEDP
jgi:alpha-D-ribose 1-methylphosphonate 5-triphosphate synthase subunit PhnG